MAKNIFRGFTNSMNIINNNMTFTSRNRVVRRADDISRMTMKKFPLVSSTRYCDSPNCIKIINSLEKLNKKIWNAREEMCAITASYKLHGIEKINAYIASAIKHNIGNCAEMTELATIIARLFNIKDTKRVGLYSKNNRDLDHMALYVENKGKPYIIDAWLGFADYVPNTIQKYKTVYKDFFGFNETKDIDMKFEEIKYNPIKKALDEMSNIEMWKLKKQVLRNK